MEPIYHINLRNFIHPKETALVGRKNGENLLKKLKENQVVLKKLEHQFQKIEIIIPEFILTMNKSFFLGFLETRVQELGKEPFLAKYIFNTSTHIKNKLEKYTDSALLNATAEEILHA